VQPRRVLRLDELVVRRARDDAAAERRNRLRAQRSADRARCVHVALRRERVARGDHPAADLGCDPAGLLLVDVGDEDTRARLGELTGEVVPDGADSLDEHAATVEVGRAEDVLDARVDAVQHPERRPPPAVAHVAGGSEHPLARFRDDVEVGRRDVHVACGAIRPAERRDQPAVA